MAVNGTSSPPTSRTGGTGIGLPGPGVFLEWVAKYGIATVFATILLLFVLWQSYQGQQNTLQIVQQIQADQREVVHTLADVTRTLDRISVRIEQGR